MSSLRIVKSTGETQLRAPPSNFMFRLTDGEVEENLVSQHTTPAIEYVGGALPLTIEAVHSDIEHFTCKGKHYNFIQRAAEHYFKARTAN